MPRTMVSYIEKRRFFRFLLDFPHPRKQHSRSRFEFSRFEPDKLDGKRYPTSTYGPQKGPLQDGEVGLAVRDPDGRINTESCDQFPSRLIDSRGPTHRPRGDLRFSCRSNAPVQADALGI